LYSKTQSPNSTPAGNSLQAPFAIKPTSAEMLIAGKSSGKSGRASERATAKRKNKSSRTL
jgi:hypothetical protein